MSAVPQQCLNDAASLKKTLSDDLKQVIQTKMYGGSPCCDTFGMDVKIYMANYILNKYNPNSGLPDILYPLTDKEIQCICDWVSRHKYSQNPS